MISTFFEQVTQVVPLLHQPTFQREYDSRLYESNEQFRSLCMVVFACGDKYSENPTEEVEREGKPDSGLAEEP